MSAENYELDDEFEYHAYRVGRPTRTVEIDAPGGVRRQSVSGVDDGQSDVTSF